MPNPSRAVDGAAVLRSDGRRLASVGPDGELPPALLDRLADRLGPEVVARRARHRFVDSRRPVAHDHLAQLRAAAMLGADDLVERRPSVIFELAGTVLRFEGKEIRFPRVAREALGIRLRSSVQAEADAQANMQRVEAEYRALVAR